jgi:tetratricopeptide (TPR) repeat protein
MKRPLIAALALCLAGAALAGDLDDARDALRQRQYEQALRAADAHLASHPQDADGLVVKAVILGQLGRTAEAIQLNEDTIRLYPNLPEPRNNLAVLYASLGQYEKARAALEAALHTHPSYAAAYDNLGAVYNRMASLAYDKALGEAKKTEKAPPVAVLAVLTDTRAAARAAEAPGLRLAVSLPERAYAPASTTVLAAAPTAKPVAPAPPQKPLVTAQASAATAPKPAATLPPAPEKPVAAPAKPAPPPEKPAPPVASTTPADDSRALEDAVNGWARAWSTKNFAAYVGYYAHDFKPPKGESRAAWEKTRRERIAAPKSIKVGISNLQVHMKDGNHARVTFRQSYEAGALKNATTKTLEMERSGKRWLIVEERIGK